MFLADRSYVLRQVRILDPVAGRDRVGDLWIEAGQLQAVEFPLQAVPDGATVVDGSSWVVGPGLVDLYAQSGEPGYEQRETMHSLAQAAIAGGFTQVALLPTTYPVTDSPAQIERILRHAQPDKTPQWHPLAAITLGAKGEAMTELGELADCGAVAFCDNRPILSLLLLRRVLEYLQPLQKPVLLWPQERSLAGAGVMQEGDWSVRLGLNGIPAAAEVTAVASVLELVRAIGTPVHLMRLTQSRSLDLVQQAQQTGVPVTASTTWMHLLLTDADIERWPYHPSLHLHAPLGTAADRQALLAGVTAGIVGAIASDHTPYTFEEKTVAFEEAPPGAIGLELALPLLWQELVGKRTLDALTLWSALSNRPAQYLNCPMPELQTGAAANLVMFAPDRSWTVSHQTLHSLSQATPWLGRTLNGKVLGCWLGGQWLSGERLVVPA